jgi:hypothetical protein
MLVPAILVIAAFAAHAVAPRDEYPHVRMPQPRIAHLVANASLRSPTFASLLRHLQDTDVVVFVATSTALAPRITGRTVLVNATSTVRYLQAEVRADAPEPEILLTIAHELQHAIEIAASDVRDERALARLFESIGERHGRGFESDRAREVGARVRRELSQRPPGVVVDNAHPKATAPAATPSRSTSSPLTRASWWF